VVNSGVGSGRIPKTGSSVFWVRIIDCASGAFDCLTHPQQSFLQSWSVLAAQQGDFVGWV
jgi:hypothetical protein